MKILVLGSQGNLGQDLVSVVSAAATRSSAATAMSWM
jgi:dTDP-4-dehydrorhamnose reductase